MGGAETVLLRLICDWPDNEDEHHVVSLSTKSAMRQKFESHATSVTIFDWRLRFRIFSEVSGLRHLVSALNPDMIVGWMYHGNIGATIASVGTSRPMIWNIRHSLHSLKDERRLTQMAIRLNRILSRRPSAIIYNSVASAKHHEAFGFSESRTRVIANGFDTDMFKPIPEARKEIRSELGIGESELVITCVARYHPVKDHRSLLAAVAQALRVNGGIRLLLVGSDIDESNAMLNQWIDELGIRENVLLAGARDDIWKIYAASDIAVSASLTESFPNSVAEAMSSGLYCIATNVGDVRDILDDTGAVVTPGDADELAQRLQDVVEMCVVERAKAGRMARDRVLKKYTLRLMVTNFRDCFRDVSGRDTKCVE